MSDPDDPAYRLRHRAAGSVTLREPEDVDSDEPMMEIRMPIATTGEVRNEGDDPLTREKLDGMARQIAERQIGVFAGHGTDTTVADGMYSPFGRLGDWTDAEVESRESEDVLMATARMPDPEELAAATGPYRQGLAVLKEQAKRGIAQDASIGWRDDESFPGGVDLMEASIVGIGADWRTNTGDEAAEVVARAAIEAGADRETLVDVVREATADTQHDEMSTDDDSGTDAGTDAEQNAPDDEGDETTTHDADEFRARMLEMQQQQTELLRTLTEREDSDDDEDDDEEENESDEDEEDEDDEEQSASPDSEQSADTDTDEERDLAAEVESLRSELDDLRSGGMSAEDVDTPEPDSEQNADAGEESRDTDTDAESPTDGLGDYR